MEHQPVGLQLQHPLQSGDKRRGPLKIRGGELEQTARHGLFDRLGRVVGDEPALVHQAHPVAALRFVHVGRADENRQAFFGAQVAQQVPEFTAADRVHAQGRLIQHHHLRLVDQTASQGQLFFHASGEPARQPPGEAAQSGEFEQFGDAAALLAPADSLHVRKEAHVLLHRHIGGQGKLLGDIAHALADVKGIAHGIVTQDAALSAAAFEQAQNDAGSRRLARSIRPDEAKGLAAPHLQV